MRNGSTQNTSPEEDLSLFPGCGRLSALSHALETCEVNLRAHEILGALFCDVLEAVFCVLRFRRAEELAQESLELFLGERPGLVVVTRTLNADLGLIAEFHLVNSLVLRLLKDFGHLEFEFTALITQICESLVDLLDALIDLAILANEWGKVRHLCTVSSSWRTLSVFKTSECSLKMKMSNTFGRSTTRSIRIRLRFLVDRAKRCGTNFNASFTKSAARGMRPVS